MKSKIPWLRKMFPTFVDNFGKEKTYGADKTQIFLNAVLNPMGVNSYSQSAVSKELQNARESTGDTSFYAAKSAVGPLDPWTGKIRNLPMRSVRNFRLIMGRRAWRI